MRIPRCFSETLIGPDVTQHVTLRGAEAHHVMHVLRRSIGDELCLFDGSGREFPARIVGTSRQHLECEILRVEPLPRESQTRLVLGVAVPKGDRQRTLVEKCVELGVLELVPLITHYSVAEAGHQAIVRWRRAVIESCKQCGRNVLMRVSTAVPIREFLRNGESTDHRWFVDELADLDAPLPTSLLTGKSITAAVGPEGGWHPDERQAAVDLGWRRVSLGPRILRTETAALAIAVACLLAENAAQAKLMET